MTERLDRAEMIDILEEIARESSNAAARIAAIKQLELMNDGERPPAEGFAELDQDIPRIRRKAA